MNQEILRIVADYLIDHPNIEQLGDIRHCRELRMQIGKTIVAKQRRVRPEPKCGANCKQIVIRAENVDCEDAKNSI